MCAAPRPMVRVARRADRVRRSPWLRPRPSGRRGFALTPDITLAANVVDTVRAYVFGAVARDLAEEQAQRRSGLTEDQWRESVAPYIREVIDSGAYPQFARRVAEAEDADPEERFEFGLACVLDGIATRADAVS
ncbi:TetR/AcrR family transcriptional regulator C-terminal domain-containing protein [Microtetraspora malaysiensis]|uniref:TetR/AcrR family transcriptional regulator C-terminal domain-containing protein n=1 Tax=Microtetraspora malaysiensis TaxID=161358 RepID=UPI003D8C5303